MKPVTTIKTVEHCSDTLIASCSCGWCKAFSFGMTGFWRNKPYQGLNDLWLELHLHEQKHNDEEKLKQTIREVLAEVKP